MARRRRTCAPAAVVPLAPATEPRTAIEPVTMIIDHANSDVPVRVVHIQKSGERVVVFEPGGIKANW